MKLIIAALALTASSLAFANRCPMEMKAIDAKLATATLSAEDMSKVKALRAEGETMHKAGKHDESVKALDEAKKMLGM